MGGFANFGGFDDGLTGDGYGSGVVDSVDAYSGIDLVNDPEQGDASLGSTLQLDYTSGITEAGVADFADGASVSDSVNLAGNTDTPPVSYLASDYSDNGSGSAGQQPNGALQPASGQLLNTSLNALSKFGASLSSLFSTPRSSPIVRPASTLPGYPSTAGRAPATSISSAHMSLVVVVVLVIAVGIAFGGGSSDG